MGRRERAAQERAIRSCMATFAPAISSSARKASAACSIGKSAQSGDPMQDLGWVCVKTWRFGGSTGRRIWHARGFFRGLREGQRTVRSIPAHVRFWEAFGSVQVGGSDCLRLGTARSRGSRDRAMRDRPAHRRAAVGFFQSDRRPRLTNRLTICSSEELTMPQSFPKARQFCSMPRSNTSKTS